MEKAPTRAFSWLKVPTSAFTCRNLLRQYAKQVLINADNPFILKFLNVKVLVGPFNQEKALVGAFSVIVKTDCETDGSFLALAS